MGMHLRRQAERGFDLATISPITPQLVYTCHCVDYQRLTSSAFSLGMVVPEQAFRLTGVEPQGDQQASGMLLRLPRERGRPYRRAAYRSSQVTISPRIYSRGSGVAR